MVLPGKLVLFLVGREHGHFKSGVAEVSQAPGAHGDADDEGTLAEAAAEVEDSGTT